MVRLLDKFTLDNPEGYVKRGALQEMFDAYTARLQSGRIVIPPTTPQQANYAGESRPFQNSHGSRESALNRPSQYAYARRKGLMLKPQHRSPLAKEMSLTVESQRMVIAPITRLLVAGRPPAIFFAVIPVIINALNGVLRRRTRAHVAVKSLKRISPFGADLNAPRSVNLVLLAIRIIATLSHAIPQSIFRYALAATAHSMFDLDASTRTRPPAMKVSDTDLCFCAALALARNPIVATAVFARECSYLKLSKTVSNVDNKSGWHVLPFCLENVLARLVRRLPSSFEPYCIIA